MKGLHESAVDCAESGLAHGWSAAMPVLAGRGNAARAVDGEHGHLRLGRRRVEMRVPEICSV
jgi:hypothetical protein